MKDAQLALAEVSVAAICIAACFGLQMWAMFVVLLAWVGLFAYAANEADSKATRYYGLFQSAQRDIDQQRNKSFIDQDLIDKLKQEIKAKEDLIQVQSDTINDIITLAEEYRNDRYRRIPWARLARLIGLIKEGE